MANDQHETAHETHVLDEPENLDEPVHPEGYYAGDGSYVVGKSLFTPPVLNKAQGGIIITHISYGETFNLGNFRSKRVDVTGRVHDDGDPDTINRAYAHLRDTARRLAESHEDY